MQRTTEHFPRMKDRAWARRNRRSLAVRTVTRSFRRMSLAVNVSVDALGDFYVALAGPSGNRSGDRG